ncbi:MAG: SDR family NAD(P)-dependent oxidoreductase, partial [Gammaproteobacteria bacterium]|nr:SDR family NAD(P)-dependent oxidoreductase [Gammaproteobacteria bacterium]
MDILLVARRAALLSEAKTAIEALYPVTVKVIALDLTADAALEYLFEQTKNLDVGLLIPSAGVELNGLFVNASADENKHLLRLNAEIPMLLAHHYGQRMATRNRGAILFISSGFGYQAVPYIANYSASKAYILALGEALHRELKEHGVVVTVLSPGLTKTAMTDDSTIDFTKLPITSMTPDAVANVGFNVLGRKASEIAGFLNKFYVFQNRFVPRMIPTIIFGLLMRRAIREEAKGRLLSVAATERGVFDLDAGEGKIS